MDVRRRRGLRLTSTTSAPREQKKWAGPSRRTRLGIDHGAHRADCRLRCGRCPNQAVQQANGSLAHRRRQAVHYPGDHDPFENIFHLVPSFEWRRSWHKGLSGCTVPKFRSTSKPANLASVMACSSPTSNTRWASKGLATQNHVANTARLAGRLRPPSRRCSRSLRFAWSARSKPSRRCPPATSTCASVRQVPRRCRPDPDDRQDRAPGDDHTSPRRAAR